MTLRFTKADRNTGVDGHFFAADARVIVKPSDFPAPLYPEDAGFWDQFSDTINALCVSKDNARMGAGVSAPLQNAGINTGGKAAALVRSDWPTDIMLIAAKAVPGDYRGFTGLSGGFTDRVVLMNHLMAWAAWQVSASSFAAKWEFLVPRPEEVAGAIARDEIDAPMPIKMRLYDVVSQDKLVDDQRQFTMFKEGSPDHPSYNAMHAAAAGAACAIIRTMLHLDEYRSDDVGLTAYNMAHFRSNAGVHYPQDNRAGLWLGQEVVRRMLPAKLSEIGVPVTETEAALDNANIDWLAA